MSQVAFIFLSVWAVLLDAVHAVHGQQLRIWRITRDFVKSSSVPFASALFVKAEKGV